MGQADSARSGPTPGSPGARGAVWGIGVSAMAVQFLLNRSTISYEALAILFFGAPVVLAVCIIACVILYGRLARSRERWTARGSLPVAFAGAAVLAALPWVAQTIQLRWMAAELAPGFPGASYVRTTVHGGAPANFEVHMRTNAKDEDIREFYAQRWRDHGWHVTHDGNMLFGSEPEGTIYLSMNPYVGEVTVTWHRTYHTH